MLFGDQSLKVLCNVKEDKANLSKNVKIQMIFSHEFYIKQLYCREQVVGVIESPGFDL